MFLTVPKMKKVPTEDIKSIINPNIELEFGVKEYYPHQPMYLVADVSELTQDTGWTPNVLFCDGVEGLCE